MNAITRHLATAVAAAALGSPVLAATGFQATVVANAQIVEVLDPNGPRVRFESMGTAASTLGAAGYLSTDVVDLGTGQGQGVNRFVFGGGDELTGAFDVQIAPTGAPGQFSLLGTVQFTGGSGLYAGASGSAGFSGLAQFVSDTQAQLQLSFDGQLQPVPEPAGAWLMLAGLALLARRRLR